MKCFEQIVWLFDLMSNSKIVISWGIYITYRKSHLKMMKWATFGSWNVLQCGVSQKLFTVKGIFLIMF